jgi:hypothetical protein
MEETVRWYKKHLAGFVESFEEDMQIDFKDELEAFADWILDAVEHETGAMVSGDAKYYLKGYLLCRARDMTINHDMDGDPWFNEDHKLLRYIIK